MIVNLNELTITVDDAAKLIGVGKERLKESLKQNLFPFGVATRMASGQWQYTIFRTKLLKYLEIPFELVEGE